MKRPTTLSVSEFRQLIDKMLDTADDELSSTRARLEVLRAGTLPPG